ncbi:hypothetical protein M0R45_019446 [Rubus argutus]|uniref:Secreted protein n=1 Tax=Rubus argutus TaxID=59490 RepID=A0AAW1X7C8_RUBAR
MPQLLLLSNLAVSFSPPCSSQLFLALTFFLTDPQFLWNVPTPDRLHFPGTYIHTPLASQSPSHPQTPSPSLSSLP